MRFIFLIICTVIFNIARSQTLSFAQAFHCTEDGSYPSAISTSHDGKIYLAGHWHGIMDFDPGPIKKEIKSTWGNDDWFIITLDQKGNYLSHISSGSNDPFDRVTAMTVGNDNQMYFVAEYYNNPSINIVKSSKWARSLAISHINDVQIFQILADSEKSLYVLGKGTKDIVISAGDTLHLSGSEKNFLIKIDDSNKILHYWTFDGVSANDKVIITKMSIDKNDNLVMCGSVKGKGIIRGTNREDTISSSGATDPLFFKYNNKGEIQWVKHLEVKSNQSASFSDLGIDGENDIFLTGAASGNIDYDESTITLYNNANGSFILQSKEDGTFSSLNVVAARETPSIVVSQSGSYVIRNRFYEGGDVDARANGFLNLYIGGQNYLPYIVKFNKKNELQWGKRLLVGGQATVGILTMDDDENVFVGGYVYDNIKLEGPSGVITLKAYDAHLRSAHIEKYENEICTSSERPDYFLAMDFNDKGQEPFQVTASTIPWSASCIKTGTNGNTLSFSNTSSSQRDIYAYISNRGCSDFRNANLELYYSLEFQDPVWPDGWKNDSMLFNGVLRPVSGKLLDIPIPKLGRNQSWAGLSNFKLINPVWYGKDQIMVNILARIVSAQDIMNKPEGSNLIDNVISNNNIAWKTFLIVK